jgi:hypothetical protein
MYRYSLNILKVNKREDYRSGRESVFDCSNTGIVCSILTKGMNMSFFCVFSALCKQKLCDGPITNPRKPITVCQTNTFS